MEEQIILIGNRIDLLILSLLAKGIFMIQAMKVLHVSAFYRVRNCLKFIRKIHKIF